MLVNYLLIIFCCLSLLCSVLVIISKNPIHSILYLILVFCNVTFVLIILGIEFIAIIFLIVYVGAIAVLFLFVVMMLNIKILELDEVFWKYIPVGLLISSIFLFQIFFLIFKFNVVEVCSLFFYDGFFSLKKVYFENCYPGSFGDFSFVNGVYYYNSPVTTVSVDFKDLLLSLYKEDWVVFIFNKSFFHDANSLNLAFELTNTELLGWLIYTYTFFIFLVVSLILLIAMIGSIILVLNQNINIKRQLVFRQTLRDLKSSVTLKN
jgi:NADH:ubiquinone oxidoreductase subunit 6 (subunit J)